MDPTAFAEKTRPSLPLIGFAGKNIVYITYGVYVYSISTYTRATKGL